MPLNAEEFAVRRVNNVRDFLACNRSQVSHIEATILDALLGAEKIVTTDALIDAIWGDDPEGGPDDALNTLRVHINRIRSMLERSGLRWQVRTHITRGYQLTYR